MVDFTTVSWLRTAAKKEAAKDNLRTADMIGDVIAITAILILITYFVDSQVANSGFFTAKFGSLEAFFFYAVAVVGLFPPALRLILRKRNAVRPFEIANSLFTVVSIVYLLNVFPFDFTNLATAISPSLHSAFSWLTDDIVKLLMTLGIILTVLITAWTLVIYLTVKQVLSETGEGPL